MVTIHPITQTDFPFITQIANSQLGVGYIQEEELQSYLNSKTKFGFVAKAENRVVGFSLIGITTLEELDLLTEKEWFIEKLSAFQPIASIKQMAVKTAFQRKGIAKLLMEENSKVFEGKVKSLLGIAWERDGEVAAKKMLESVGMKALKKMENYWAAESVAQNYACPQCGEPPCTCSAVVFGLTV